MLVAEDRADHIDLNFGCPVPKVTRKGGGAALPWKLGLFREIVEGAVKAAGPIPLTVKMRKGIDSDHLTYLEAAKAAAEGAGVASIALHARTAAEFYSGSRGLVGDRDAQGDDHRTPRCSATATSGRRPTRSAWSTRPAATASSSAAAASAVRGCSATWRRRSAPVPANSMPRRRRAPRRIPPSGRSRPRSGGTPSCSSSSSRAKSGDAATSASTSPGTSRATPSGATSARAWPPSTRSPHLDDLLAHARLGPAVPRRGGRRSSAVAPARPKRPSLPDGWLASRELDGYQRAEVAEAEVNNSGG